MNKEKRKDIRIPLLTESVYWSKQIDTLSLITSKMTDISKNGLFIESNEYPIIGEIVKVCFKLPSDLGVLPLNAKVTWRRWASSKKNKLPIGFGVNIIHEDPKLEQIMDKYVIYLRNKQIILVSKRIIEEFFGQKPNDKGPVA
jgi:Tfp pilus assembly protein PilZ